MIKPRNVVGIVLCSAALMAGSGCEDSAAQQRDAVQASISQISRELSVAMAGVTGADDGKTVRELNAVLTKLNGVTGGEAGQQAAKAMLAASAQQQLASIHLARTQSMQSAHADLRSMLNAKVDAVTRLTALAANRAAYNITPQIDELGKQVESAQQHVEQLQAKITELDGPINERTTQNQTNQQEVDRLRIEVAELASQARNLGASAGLSTFNQATERRRQADKIEFDISNREIELDYGLTPDHQMASKQLEELNTLIATLGTTRDELQAMAQAAATDAEESNKAVASLLGEIKAGLETLTSETEGTLKTEYDDAIALLEKAGTQADGAGRQLKGEDAQAARMMAARIRETLGRAHASQARAWGDHTNLLQRLVDSGAEGAATFKSQLSAAETARSEAVTKATEAFTAAQEAAGQVQSKSDPQAVASFQQGLETALANLQGKGPAPSAEPTDAPVAETSAETPATETTAAPSDDAAGFESPEALVAHINEIASNGEPFAKQVVSVVRISRATTPEGEQAIKIGQQMGQAMVIMYEAMAAKFDPAAASAAMGSMGMPASMPPVDAQSISNRTDTTATVATTDAAGNPDDLGMVNVDGKWYVSGDPLDPADQQEMAMMGPMAPLMVKSANDVAKRIKAGEFATADEAMMAFQAGLMPGMGG